MSRAGSGGGGGALACCCGMGGPFPEKMIAPTERHHSAIRHSPGSDPAPKSVTGGGAISALPGTVAYSRGQRGRRSHCVDNHGRKLLPRLLLRERLLAEALAAVIPLAHLVAAPHLLHDIRHPSLFTSRARATHKYVDIFSVANSSCSNSYFNQP